VYAWRLDCARERDPTWLRYQWFSGYMAFRQGRPDQAAPLLEVVHELRPERFPVESLNASMVLATVHARQGRRDAASAVLDDALAYHRRMRDDFEVAVNFRLGPWLEQAAETAAQGALEAIEPYPFPY
jgi:ATP/maltotriose-dependent transcriptional regulator MalT